MVGELVMDRFRLLERLGSGGMGTVYRGFDERLQRYVAVKEVAADVDSARVLREAQAAARLNHPGIVTLYEFGMEGSRALLVSELVAGATLGQAVRGGEISDRDVAEIGSDLCEALAHAHERGVVHRDVKPHNVIVRDEEWAGRRAKLMDFGIAAVAGSQTLTASGEVVGSLAYMAPEQAEGIGGGGEADVYSLALTLYECWAGENPVAAASPAETARRIGEPVPPLRRLRPDLPHRLTDRIDACLDPDPEDRGRLDELREELDAATPALDAERCVPAAERSPRTEWAHRRESALRVAAVVTTALIALAFAAYGSRPGLGAILAVLLLPPLILVRPLRAALLPLLALPLAALGGAALYPVGAAIAARDAPSRALLGALGWCWLMVAAAIVGGLPDLGLAGDAPRDWARSAASAVDGPLLALMQPEALLGATIFAAAAAALGWVLDTGHLALALLAGLLWSAVTAASLALVGDGSLGASPALVAAAALVAVLVAHRGHARTEPRPRARPRTVRALPHPS